MSSGGLHSSPSFGGLGAGGLNHTGGLGGLNHAGGLNNSGGLNHTGSLNRSGITGQHQPSFVNNHVHGNSHVMNHSGNFNNGNNFSHHNSSFWRNRSFFFGAGSPFGFYLGYPWWWGGFGNRFGFFPYYGFGYGFGYGLGGYDYAYPYYFGYQPICSYDGYGNGGAATVAVQDPNAPSDDQLQNSLDYAGQGEIDFKQGKYQAAIQNWRHALVDDPTNGAIVLLLGQAMFAAGQYNEAAGATQAALRLLPPDKWGTVVIHYKELYPNIQDYTNQIRAAEKARDAKPDDPALHFLLGFHFGYLGYPKHAVKELDKTLELAPKDELAKKLRDEFAAKLDGADKPTPDAPKKPQDAPADGSTET